MAYVHHAPAPSHGAFGGSLMLGGPRYDVSSGSDDDALGGSRRIPHLSPWEKAVKREARRLGTDAVTAAKSLSRKRRSRSKSRKSKSKSRSKSKRSKSKGKKRGGKSKGKRGKKKGGRK